MFDRVPKRFPQLLVTALFPVLVFSKVEERYCLQWTPRNFSELFFFNLAHFWYFNEYFAKKWIFASHYSKVIVSLESKINVDQLSNMIRYSIDWQSFVKSTAKLAFGSESVKRSVTRTYSIWSQAALETS